MKSFMIINNIILIPVNYVWFGRFSKILKI